MKTLCYSFGVLALLLTVTPGCRKQPPVAAAEPPQANERTGPAVLQINHVDNRVINSSSNVSNVTLINLELVNPPASSTASVAAGTVSVTEETSATMTIETAPSAPAAGTLPLVSGQSAPAVAPAGWKRFDARSGSKVRIEGTSSIHDWQVEGKLIGGWLETGPGFPTEPGQAVTPGPLEAKALVRIPVLSLASIDQNGSPYSDRMNEIMYGKLLAPPNSTIFYTLDQLVLKELPKTNGEPYVLEAMGALGVAGVTNSITMPVMLFPLGNGKLELTGQVSLTMSSFKIKPPAFLSISPISTGDPVQLKFDWILAHKTATNVASGR